MKRLNTTEWALGLVAVVLMGCGANESPVPVDGAVFNRAQALPPSAATPFARMVVSKSAKNSSALAAVRNPTASELFDWAELTYPSLFPVRTSNQTFDVYTYRYYPTTDLILAVTGSTVLGLVGVNTSAPRVVPLGSLGDYTCLVLPTLCSGTPAAIDATSVSNGMGEVAAFLSVCTKTVGRQAGAAANTASAPANNTSLIGRALMAAQTAKTLVRSTDGGAGRAATTPPADKLGDCGGRMSHPSYYHVSGVTTATNLFDNYCQTDSDTGGKQIINGSVSYVKTGTPTPSGPLTTRMVSNSPAGLSFVTKNSSGATVTAQTFSFSNYVYTPGVPGGSATATNPDRVLIDEFTIADALTGKSYRQTGYAMATYDVTGGGSQTTVSGRGYRSNGTYYDMSSTVPMTTNASGNYTGGAFTFTGAGGTTAIATLVPGSKLQATMTVGGAPLTNVPVCSN